MVTMDMLEPLTQKVAMLDCVRLDKHLEVSAPSQTHLDFYEKKRFLFLSFSHYMHYFFTNPHSVRAIQNTFYSKKMEHELQPYDLLWNVDASFKLSKDVTSGSKNLISSL